MEHYGIEEGDVNNAEGMNVKIESSIKIFKMRYLEKWAQCNRTSSVFESRFMCWLNSHLLSDELSEQLQALKIDTGRQSSSSGISQGRPVREFKDLSARSKRRRTEEIRGQSSTYELLSATKSALGHEYKRTEAKVIQAVQLGSPNTMKRLMSAL